MCTEYSEHTAQTQTTRLPIRFIIFKKYEACLPIGRKQTHACVTPIDTWLDALGHTETTAFGLDACVYTHSIGGRPISHCICGGDKRVRLMQCALHRTSRTDRNEREKNRPAERSICFRIIYLNYTSSTRADCERTQQV